MNTGSKHYHIAKLLLTILLLGTLMLSLDI